MQVTLSADRPNPGGQATLERNQIQPKKKKTKGDHLLTYRQIYSSLFILLYYYVYLRITVMSLFVLPLVRVRVRRTPEEAMSKMELFVKMKLGQTSANEMYVILKLFPSFLLRNIYTFVTVLILNHNRFSC